MRLTVKVDERTHWIEVPDELLDADDFFRMMDRDMDRGWRMGPEWVESPNAEQRAQIAADRLLVSLASENRNMIELMAAYIVKRIPGVTGVDIDTGGEMLNTRLLYDTQPAPPPRAAAPRPAARRREQAIEQAGRDVTEVYRVGKAYRFARLDRRTGQWIESPLLATEAEARAARLEAFDERFEELLGSGS
ncbi:MAG TPA: hypothetical protein VGA00_02115 [Acidiferrobacterales bacterium]|jgi:hypothetical protein